MKNILWLCNRPVEEVPDKRDGTWFTAMAKTLIDSSYIKLSIIAQDKVKNCVRYDWENISQWIIPHESMNKSGLPSAQTVNFIRNISEKVNPDLIHIWGTENFWGLLTARKYISVSALLEIQGLKYVYAPVYFGGIPLSNLIRNIGPLEIALFKNSLLLGKYRFEKWGQFEKEMISKHKYIGTQSSFVRAHIKYLNRDAVIYNSGIMLREEFYKAQTWLNAREKQQNEPVLFTSSAIGFPYKGLHVVIDAIGILKKKYPCFVLNIAGNIIKKGIRQSCYARFLINKIAKLGISSNIKFLGPLDADNIITNYYKASAVVVPSFIETYSLALAEAMYIGVPVVASYAGAMPELAKDGESALFFPVGDAFSCAMQIDRILSDNKLAEELSINARKIGLQRNNKEAVLKRQIEIYNDILARGGKKSE